MTQVETSAGRTAAAVRELILHGELPPGARLGEVELAERLGVSRTPVREALSRLAAERLVEIVPNRGARVASWTVEEMEGVFDLRAALEPRLTAFAVPRAGPSDADALDDLAGRMSQVGTPGPGQDLDAVVPLNRQFHDRLVALAAQPGARGSAGRRRARPDRPAQLPHLRRHLAASQPRPPPRDRRRRARRRPGVGRGRHDRTHPQRPRRHGAGRPRSTGGLMSYRLGVDVGGTFTDVLLVDEDSGATWRAKTASTPADQSVGVLHRHRQGVRRGRDRARRGRPGAARHDRRHQRDPGGQGRHGRAGDDQGLPAGAADRPVLRARAGWPAGSSGPSRSRWPRWRTPSRSTSGSAATARWSASSTRTTSARSWASCTRDRGAGRLADQRLRQRRARAAHRARSPPRSCPACRSRCPATCCPRCASTSGR